jgi:hypothetical protein
VKSDARIVLASSLMVALFGQSTYACICSRYSTDIAASAHEIVDISITDVGKRGVSYPIDGKNTVPAAEVGYRLNRSLRSRFNRRPKVLVLNTTEASCGTSVKEGERYLVPIDEKGIGLISYCSQWEWTSSRWQDLVRKDRESTKK